MFYNRYKPDFNTKIPSKVEFQLSSESFGHKLNEYWRLFRREISLFFSGQKFYERKTIPAKTKKILWLAPSIKNIGDAVMAFSGRTLLEDKFQVDLLADGKLISLFENDKVFVKVYSNPGEISQKYDLIILDSVKSVSLKMKKRYFRNTPYCHFRGHFDGIEFNWILFSYHRINALLNYPYNQIKLDEIAKPYLHLPTLDTYKLAPIILAVGGEDLARRVYAHWDKVIEIVLNNKPLLKIVLVGNHNGLGIADILVSKYASNLDNKVAKLSLLDTAKLINSCKYYLGCDGGLMHIASACGLTGVALFGYFEPEYRLSYHSTLKALYNQSSVNLIDPEIVANTVLQLIDLSESTR